VENYYGAPKEKRSDFVFHFKKLSERAGTKERNIQNGQGVEREGSISYPPEDVRIGLGTVRKSRKTSTRE